MKHQALRLVALMLSVLLATAAPARAGTVEYADVVQVIMDAQNRRARVDLRLRALTQSGRVTTSSGGQEVSSNSLTNDPPATETSTPLTGASVQTPQEGGNVQTVDLGDVTGTVCDCGEIPLPPPPPGGGFPKWPLLALAAIPLAFLGGGGEETITPPGPGPSPTPPPVVIPEPATILLFGSGLLALGAGVRRRRRVNPLATDEAVEEI